MPSVLSTFVNPLLLLAPLVMSFPLVPYKVDPSNYDSRTVFFIAIPQEWKDMMKAEYPYEGYQADWLHISRDFGDFGMRHVGVSNAADGWKPLAFSSNLGGPFGQTLGVKVQDDGFKSVLHRIHTAVQDNEPPYQVMAGDMRILPQDEITEHWDIIDGKLNLKMPIRHDEDVFSTSLFTMCPKTPGEWHLYFAEPRNVYGSQCLPLSELPVTCVTCDPPSSKDYGSTVFGPNGRCRLCGQPWSGSGYNGATDLINGAFSEDFDDTLQNTAGSEPKPAGQSEQNSEEYSEPEAPSQDSREAPVHREPTVSWDVIDQHPLVPYDKPEETQTSDESSKESSGEKSADQPFDPDYEYSPAEWEAMFGNPVEEEDEHKYLYEKNPEFYDESHDERSYLFQAPSRKEVDLDDIVYDINMDPYQARYSS